MAQSGNPMGSLLTLGAVGVGAYFLYEWLFVPPATAASAATSTAVIPATGTTSPVAVSAPTPAPAPVPSTLDSYYAAMVAANNSGQTLLNPDQWNYYLAQVTGKASPDPLAVFTQSGFDRSLPMTSAVYWASMAPYLKASWGLSGLGIYGGLGQLARAVR